MSTASSVCSLPSAIVSVQLWSMVYRYVANDEQSYRYLVESIRRFPDPDAFLAMIQQAGFARANARSLTGGVCFIHSGFKV